MSLEQVKSFYEMLNLESGVYELYYKNCHKRGVFDTSHWETKEIVNFASTLGYTFTEEELNDFWFANEPVRLINK